MKRIATVLLVSILLFGINGFSQGREGILQWYGPLIVTMEQGIELLGKCPAQQDCFPVSLISIVFDDGYASVYNKAFPILLRYQVPATVFMIANRIGLTEEFMTLDELQTLAEYGWEIGSHSYSHPSLVTLSMEEVIQELSLSKKILQEKGFQVKGFAYPFGHITPEIAQEVSKFYNYARVAYKEYKGINPIPLKDKGPGSRYELKCVIVDEYDSVDIIKALIDKVATQGGWLILVFHKIADVPRDLYIYPTHAFEEIIRYLREDLRYCTLEEFKTGRCPVRREWTAYGPIPEKKKECCGAVYVIDQIVPSGRDLEIQILPVVVCDKIVQLEFQLVSSRTIEIQEMVLTLIAPDGNENIAKIPRSFTAEPNIEYRIRINIGTHGQSGIYHLTLTLQAEEKQIELTAKIFINWPAP